MNNITIKSDENLKKLSEILIRSTTEIIDAILEVSKIEGVITDDKDLINNSLSYIYEQECYDISMGSVLCLGISNEEILDLFGKLIIFGVNDCPNCGGASEPSPNNKYHSHNERLNPSECKGVEMSVCVLCKEEF